MNQGWFRGKFDEILETVIQFPLVGSVFVGGTFDGSPEGGFRAG